MDGARGRIISIAVKQAALGAAGGRAGYTFNTTIAGIEDADAMPDRGSNPRLEAPIINARLRKRYLVEGGFKVGMVGEAARSDLSLRASRCRAADP